MLKNILLIIQIYNMIVLPKISAYECFNDSNQFYCKFGTLSPYRYIANHNDSRLNFPGCTEKKIWLMIRHGTRFPGEKNIKLMMNNLPELKSKIIKNFKMNNSELSLNLIEKLSEWNLSFNDNEAMILALEGENELIDLAERMQTRFPTIFVEDYNEEIYKFKYTATQRTESSAKSFVLGLFGQHHSQNISFPQPEHKDPILRFYKKCQRWVTEIHDNSLTFKERDLFVQSTIFQEILFDISKRIGFKIDYESVKIIYMMCAFESAWNETVKSPWCDILSFDDMQILEFTEDLKHYWVDGYGYNLNYDQACQALKDVFNFFESTDKSLVTAYFTHSGSILKMLSLLGIAKDEIPLSHTSFPAHKDFRNWRVSLIDAFASNIAFVLYNCHEQGLHILLLHQERVVQIPGCPPGALCPLSVMKQNLPDTEQECQFEVMCSTGHK